MHSAKQRREVSTFFSGRSVTCCLGLLPLVMPDLVSSWGLLCPDESREASITLQLIFLFDDCFREWTVSGKV